MFSKTKKQEREEVRKDEEVRKCEENQIGKAYLIEKKSNASSCCTECLFYFVVVPISMFIYIFIFVFHPFYFNLLSLWQVK